MVYPFAFISIKWRKLVFGLLFATTIAIGVVLNIIGTPLVTDAAPAGILSYELAGNIDNVQKILTSWDQNALLRAAFVQGFDFLFIPVYVTAIGVGCGIAADLVKRKNRSLSPLGTILAWAIIFAGIFDIIENIALTKMLFGRITAPWPQISFWCAALKFVIIILALSYIMYGALYKWIKKVPLT